MTTSDESGSSAGTPAPEAGSYEDELITKLTAVESQVTPENLWLAYESARSHYNEDLNLYTSRMNLFLLVESGLLALVGGAALKSDEVTILSTSRWWVAGFGILLSALWFLVAIFCYRWIRIWRGHVTYLGRLWEQKTEVVPSFLLFTDGLAGRLKKRLPTVWDRRFRPTIISCVLPVFFLAAWILVGCLHS